MLLLAGSAITPAEADELTPTACHRSFPTTPAFCMRGSPVGPMATSWGVPVPTVEAGHFRSHSLCRRLVRRASGRLLPRGAGDD
jgi:hypothetical protein